MLDPQMGKWKAGIFLEQPLEHNRGSKRQTGITYQQHFNALQKSRLRLLSATPNTPLSIAIGRITMNTPRTFFACTLFLAGCAASSPNYSPPSFKGSEPAIVIAGTRAFAGSACLSRIVVDGEFAGTVGPQETLVIPTKPGKYFIRWDFVGNGLCPREQDLAHRLVTVTDSPVLLKLDISGMGKAFIPIFGMFTKPEHRILAEGED